MTPAGSDRAAVAPPTAMPPSATLEGLLAALEASLGALGDALRRRDADALETHAHALQAGLQRAVDAFGAAARRGNVPPALRTRLVQVSTQVAAQRESLSRATAALDRAMDALWPRNNQAVYGLRGHAARATAPRFAGSVRS